MAETIGRNEPCHCGSGNKYKNCCLKKDSSSMKSKMGIGLLIVVVILGIWILGSAFSANDGGMNCPAGKSWSPEHQHCH